MFWVPDGRAANQPLAVVTFSPPMGALFPGARVSFANMADGGAQVVVEWRRTMLEGVEGKPAMKETVL